MMLEHTKYVENIADRVKEKFLDKDLDYVVIITGREGSGKSTLAMDLCDAVADNFSPKDIVFNSGELRKRADKLGKKSGYNALNVDEGSNIFSRLDTMTTEAKKAVKKITMMRTYNLFITLCISDIEDLHKYFIRHRMQNEGILLLRVTTRGRFWIFGNHQLRKMRKELLKSSKEFKWRKYKKKAMSGAFKDISSQNSEFWEKYKERKISSISEKEEEYPTLSKKEAAFQLLGINPELRNSPKKLAQPLGTSRGYASDLIAKYEKRYVRSTVSS